MNRPKLKAAAGAGIILLLAAATQAQIVVATGGDSIVLSSGAEAGVRKGMTGKICAPETVGGHIVMNCSARFVVTSVSNEKSIAHITKGDSNIATGTLANFDKKLSPPREERKTPPPKKRELPPKRDEAAVFLNEADRAFREGDYRGALERYESFLHANPNHAQADFAADRAYQCRTKISAVAVTATAVSESTSPPPATSNSVSPPPATPQPEVPAGLRRADELAATAERLFSDGQFGDARASALEALRTDSTNPRARATLRAVQVKSVQSRFNTPTDLAVSGAGCYVADAGNNTLRLIRPNGSVTVAGSAGQHGFVDGPATRARFNAPSGVALAQDDTVYVADRYNETIRKIVPSGAVTTFAGRSGLSGMVDGPANSARFHEPRRIVIGADGTIYVSDTGNHAVRRLSPSGIVDTIASSSDPDRMDPVGLAMDAEGNVLIADSWSHVIRKIDGGGRLSVFAGVRGASGNADGPVGSARFSAPEGVAVDAAGAVYVADTANHIIRKIANGVVTTVAGAAGIADAVDGNGPVARFNRPSGLRYDTQGRLWIADSGNHAIRLMSAGFVETVAGLAGNIGSSDGTN